MNAKKIESSISEESRVGCDPKSPSPDLRENPIPIGVALGLNRANFESVVIAVLGLSILLLLGIVLVLVSRGSSNDFKFAKWLLEIPFTVILSGFLGLSAFEFARRRRGKV